MRIDNHQCVGQWHPARSTVHEYKPFRVVRFTCVAHFAGVTDVAAWTTTWEEAEAIAAELNLTASES